MTPNSPDIAIKVHNDTFRHIMAEERKRNNKPTPSPTRPHPCPAGLNKIVHLNKWLLSCARNTTTFPSPSLSPRPSVSCHSSNWPLCTTHLSLSRCPPITPLTLASPHPIHKPLFSSPSPNRLLFATTESICTTTFTRHVPPRHVPTSPLPRSLHFLSPTCHTWIPPPTDARQQDHAGILLNTGWCN